MATCDICPYFWTDQPMGLGQKQQGNMSWHPAQARWKTDVCTGQGDGTSCAVCKTLSRVSSCSCSWLCAWLSCISRLRLSASHFARAWLILKASCAPTNHEMHAASLNRWYVDKENAACQGNVYKTSTAYFAFSGSKHTTLKAPVTLAALLMQRST